MSLVVIYFIPPGYSPPRKRGGLSSPPEEMILRFAADKPMAKAAAPPPPPPLVPHFQFAPTKRLRGKPQAATAQARAQVSDRSSLLGAIQAGKKLKKVDVEEVNEVDLM